MKITFILTDFPAYSQTFILQQIKNLIDQGHNVKILANNDPKQSFSQPIYYKYKLAERTEYYNDNIYDPNSDLIGLRDLLELDSDIFHCHFLPTGVALVKILDKLKCVKPVLITGYGVDIMSKLNKGEFSYLNRPNINFIAVSDAIKQKLLFLGIPSEKIWIIPLTADTEYFKMTKAKKNTVTKFISICRLVEKKGIDSAVKAFSILKNRNHKIKFRYDIYGDGPEQENIMRIISDHNLNSEIKLNDPINHKKILEIFKKSDFLIQTSKTASNGDGEGLPTVILEAQSTGVPIIGTYHSGIPEEVINKTTGFLSHEENIPEIANNLLRAIKIGQNDYKKMSRNARRLIINKFSNNSIKKSLLNLYQKIVTEKETLNINQGRETIQSQLNTMKKYTKVLFFNHTAGLGGSERSLLELIDEIQQFEVICRVVLPYKGKFCSELEKRGVDYEIIDYSWWCSMEKLPKDEQIIRMNNSFANFLGKKKLLDQWKPDIIFTNTLTIPWGAIYSLITNKPHLTFIREFGDLDFRFNFFYGFQKTIKFINDYSNYIFTNSKATLAHFKKLIDKSKIDYAYAFIDINKRLLSEKSKLIYRKGGSLKLAITGAVIVTKGHEEVVRAAATLIEKGLNIELAIIGPKHDVALVQKLQNIIKQAKASKRIKFHGFVYNPYPLLKQCDLVIVGSSNEAYGRVAVEAMALKKAILGTRSGATKELVLDGKTGYLYQPGDHEELAKKIEFLYNRRDKIKELGKNGYLHYKNTFSKDIYGMKVAKILKKIKDQKKEGDILANIIMSYQSSTSSTIANLKNEVEVLRRNQEALNYEKKGLEITLSKIYSSKAWRMLFYYKRTITVFRRLFNK